MPRHPLDQSFASIVTIYTGTTLLVLPLLFASPYTNSRIAALTGAIVGIPVVLFGLRMSASASLDKAGDPPFLPPKADRMKVLWGSLMCIALMALVAVPFILLIPLKWIPAGDDWSLVSKRLLVILTFLVIGRWWIRPASHILRGMFTGKVAHQFLSDVLEAPPVEKSDLLMTVRKNWGLVLLAAVALLVAFRIIDFNAPWLMIEVDPEMRHGNGKWTRLIRSFVNSLEWCRNHPNMTRALSMSIGLCALGTFVNRIRVAMQNLERTTEKSSSIFDEKSNLS